MHRTAALAGAANVAPVALLALGTAALAFGWTPRAVAALGMIVLGVLGCHRRHSTT
ncbi:hypothetical protein AB0E55_26910 [Amycolatopsis keratiniphila]|uniref:hypothetical protein n=1 Tax=Amycolatopsis keratiniphila TaxID=129921 RepID=UPI0033FF8190